MNRNDFYCFPARLCLQTNSCCITDNRLTVSGRPRRQNTDGLCTAQDVFLNATGERLCLFNGTSSRAAKSSRSQAAGYSVFLGEQGGPTASEAAESGGSSYQPRGCRRHQLPQQLPAGQLYCLPGTWPREDLPGTQRHTTPPALPGSGEAGPGPAAARGSPRRCRHAGPAGSC